MGGERRLWECGEPDRVFHHFHGRSEGGKGEVTFSLRPRRGRSFAPPSPLPARRRSPPQRIFFLLLFLLEVNVWLWISRLLWSSCGNCTGKRTSIWRGSWSLSHPLSFIGISSRWAVLRGRAILRTRKATGLR